jgi:hypothetical protein
MRRPSKPPLIRIPSPPNAASNFVEIRLYVTSESRHLIAALHNVLSKLEFTEVPGPDDESFAELKRILKQRIQDLENCTSSASSISTLAKAAKISD